MSREDIYQEYTRGEIEVVELGVDHDGKPQWYMSTREGWQEVGIAGTCLILPHEYYAIGTRIELSEPIPEE